MKDKDKILLWAGLFIVAIVLLVAIYLLLASSSTYLTRWAIGTIGLIMGIFLTKILAV